MTIAERILETVDALPLRQQREALRLVKRLDASQKGKADSKRRNGASRDELYVAKNPELRAIAGMWKDRADLPKDPVLAVKAIRARMRLGDAATPDNVVDSTIVIDATNNHARAIRFIDELILGGDGFTHGHVIAEVISGTRDAMEQRKLLKFLRRLKLILPNEADAEQGLKYLARFHLSHGLDFDDCVIGSTAPRLGLQVATINDRHFRLFKGLKVVRPY